MYYLKEVRGENLGIFLSGHYTKIKYNLQFKSQPKCLMK